VVIATAAVLPKHAILAMKGIIASTALVAVLPMAD